jgi:putative peptidoglycan lipid II flippase
MARNRPKPSILGFLGGAPQIMPSMFLRAGAISLILLLLSRVLGLVRETAQAAAFGASAMGDVAVLMFTLPDLVAGIFITGALGYVMLPAWAGLAKPQVSMLQRRVAGYLIAVAAIILVAIVVFQAPLAQWLAGGAVRAGAPAASALAWGAAAVPMALLAALWATRLQHERDFLGVYGANLAVNLVLVLALLFIAFHAYFSLAKGLFDIYPVAFLGAALLLAAALRLLWLIWRIRTHSVRTEPVEVPSKESATPALPAPSIWLWAAFSAGLPLALVLLARSQAASAGEGALASFNYAWKLVELPLVLAIQLVATLAFPAMAQATGAARTDAAAKALVLAWALACAAFAALIGFAQPLAQLLYGYGRMDAQGLAQVAAWARAGAWSLLPQALIAVLVTLLASEQRMRAVALAYALALGVLWLAPLLGGPDMRGGAAMMWWLNALLSGVSLAMIAAVRNYWQGAWPWRQMLAPLATALVLGQLARSVAWSNMPMALIFCALTATVVIAAAYFSSATLRATLRRA